MHIHTHTHTCTYTEMSYLKFLSKLLISFFSLGWDRHIKVLTLLLTQQLKPVCVCVCDSVKKREKCITYHKLWKKFSTMNHISGTVTGLWCSLIHKHNEPNSIMEQTRLLQNCHNIKQ